MDGRIGEAAGLKQIRALHSRMPKDAGGATTHAGKLSAFEQPRKEETDPCRDGSFVHALRVALERYPYPPLRNRIQETCGFLMPFIARYIVRGDYSPGDL